MTSVLGALRPLLALVLSMLAACAGADAKSVAVGLNDPAKKEIAMRLVSSAENSSLDRKAQY